MLTSMDYYLGVKTIENAADAIDELSFINVLDKTTLQVEIQISTVQNWLLDQRQTMVTFRRV